MRSPTEFRPAFPLSPRRRGAGIVLAFALVLLFSLRSLAGLFTDGWWFSSVGHSNVFSTVLETKVGLGLVFGAIFFAAMWGNLILTNRLGAHDLGATPEDEIVRQFQNIVRPYAGRIYGLVAIAMASVAGLAAVSQWNNYLLFANAQAFGKVDPVFHKDLGFYVFSLPFLSFLVSWTLVALLVIFIVSTLFHYLNGGIRAARVSPRVTPQVKVHLSVILALVAVTKALGYVMAKWNLVNSTNGYVQGASYTDIHARIPALSILTVISLASAGILLYNIRSRSWSLPALSVSLWVFVAAAIGFIYPAALQTLKVTPAQNTLELPLIQRNIDATRSAFAVSNVASHVFAGSSTITAQGLQEAAGTLQNIRLWDPDPAIALETFNRRQAIRSYYTITSLGVDRYVVNGKQTPVLVGARQLSTQNLTAPSWVNSHLEYTHGYGVVVSPANQADAATGNPTFTISGVPPTSSAGLPVLRQAGIYFGIKQSGWVVANSKQTELDYQVNAGTNAGQPVESHYRGRGGIAVGGLLRNAMLALRFNDYNLLISNQVTPTSRIIFVRDIMDMAHKAAPFLSFDAHPYAIVSGGRVKYVIDGYTTTSKYPYSEDAANQSVPSDTGLPSSYNYVRNSVKLVVDAFDGSMTFYNSDPSDPIVRTYAAAFPHLFVPMSTMPVSIREHLRYPTDIFAIQAATLGRYHIQSAPAFYTASDRWQISPTTGSGAPSASLAQTQTTNQVGNVVSQSLSPMSPLYQVMALPNSQRQQLVLSTAYVPAGNSQTVQSLSSFLAVTSDRDNYGQLSLYVTPRGNSVTGPVQADAEIQQNARVSAIITPLDQHGSNVLLGNNLMVPLNQAVLYVRPLYVTSSSNPLPQLKYVIAVFNQDVGIEPTLQGALSDVLGRNVSTPTGPTNSSGGGSLASHLSSASQDYSQAQNALRTGNLALYQGLIDKMNLEIKAAQTFLPGH